MNSSGLTPLTLFGVSESAWSWFQKDMGTWSDVIPEIVLSPDQAQLYKGWIQTTPRNSGFFEFLKFLENISGNV